MRLLSGRLIFAILFCILLTYQTINAEDDLEDDEGSDDGELETTTTTTTTAKPIIKLSKKITSSTTTTTTTTTTTEVPTTTTEESQPEADRKPETEGKEDEEEEEDEEEDGSGSETPETTSESTSGDHKDREVSTDEAEETSSEEDSGADVCSFNQFLSTLNISEYLPEDRAKLKKEYESFSNIPEKIRHSPSVNYTMQKLKRLFNLANGFTNRHELRSGFTSLLQQNYDLLLDVELEPACTTSIISIIAAIRRSELWALKFIDSMAKPPSGLLSGVTSFLGDFDQCLSATSPENAMEEFTGQYCLLRPILPLPEIQQYNGEKDEALIRETKLFSHLEAYGIDAYVAKNTALKFLEHLQAQRGRFLNFGVCFPSTCGPGQLEKTLNKMLYPIVGIPFEVDQSSCWTESRTKDVTVNMSRPSQFAIFTMSTMAIIVVLSTLYHLYVENYRQRSPRLSAVLVFSALYNTRTLFTDSSSAGNGRVSVFDTLRLFIVILLGLSSAFYTTPLTYGLEKMSQSVPYELLSDWKYFFIRAPSLLNDALMVISGSLFVQSVVKNINNQEDSFNGILFFVRRWLRLVAPLFGSIMMLFLLPLTSSGPFWNRLGDILLPSCQSSSSLTSSLLFYSNWNFVKNNHSNVDTSHVCNPETWFLSILFQLNLLLFIVVVFVYQSPRAGLRALYLLIAAGVVFNISPRLFHTNTLTYYEIPKQPSLWDFRRNFYLYHQNILQYVCSFTVGLLLGYALLIWNSKQQSMEKMKRPEASKPKVKFLALNLLAVLVIAGVFFWVNQFFTLNQSPSEISVLLFFSLGRLLFCIAFSWIIYVSISNKSIFFKRILSWSAIQPVARLSFSIFLVQTLVQYYRMYSIKDTYVMTFKGTIETYINDFLISVCLAYGLHLLFEGPALRINELLNTAEEDEDLPPPPSSIHQSLQQNQQFKHQLPASLPHHQQIYLENSNKHLTYVFDSRANSSALSSDESSDHRSSTSSNDVPLQMKQMHRHQAPDTDPASVIYDETTNTNIINIRF